MTFQSKGLGGFRTLNVSEIEAVGGGLSQSDLIVDNLAFGGRDPNYGPEIPVDGFRPTPGGTSLSSIVNGGGTGIMAEGSSYLNSIIAQQVDNMLREAGIIDTDGDGDIDIVIVKPTGDNDAHDKAFKKVVKTLFKQYGPIASHFGSEGLNALRVALLDAASLESKEAINEAYEEAKSALGDKFGEAVGAPAPQANPYTINDYRGLLGMQPNPFRNVD